MNCDLIARWYRWFEYIGFGRALERRRYAFITDVAGAQRVLVLGGGDGRFLAKFVKPRNVHKASTTEPCNIHKTSAKEPCLSMDYVDLSARMLDLARGRAGTDCITYHHADARAIPLPAVHYDLIVTHFFLDCLDEGDAAALVEKIARSARPDTQWLVSEFREPGWWARAIVRPLYLFFRITTGLRTRRLIDHHPLLSGSGFVLVREETERFGLLASELWLYKGRSATIGRDEGTLQEQTRAGALA